MPVKGEEEKEFLGSKGYARERDNFVGVWDTRKLNKLYAKHGLNSFICYDINILWIDH